MGFKAGMITGAIIGALGVAGAGYTFGDKNKRRKMYRKSRQMIEKAGDAIEGFTFR